MPRLPPALIRQAALESRFLPLLLRVCRDLPSARNELRWLHEHARETVAARRQNGQDESLSSSPDGHLRQEKTVTAHGNLGVDITTKPQSRRCYDGVLSTSTWMNSRIHRNRCFSTAHTKRRDPSARPKKSIAAKTVKSRRPPSLKVDPQESTSDRLFRSHGFRKYARRDGVPIRKHETVPPPYFQRQMVGIPNEAEEAEIRKLLEKQISHRAAGMPLQYILGNQPFGNLDILTPQGVLVPRPETEAYTEQVAKYIRSMVSDIALTQPFSASAQDKKTRFRILDLCTGSGCMALLVHSILKPAKSERKVPWVWPTGTQLQVLGVDWSGRCVDIANNNLRHNLSRGLLHPDAESDISFKVGDVLKLGKPPISPNGIQRFLNDGLNVDPDSTFDVIISNPPYISPRDYAPGGRTEPSVRKYEPKMALVPEGATSTSPGDLFYWPLTRILQSVGANLLVMEVGDREQAHRVHRIVARQLERQATKAQANVAGYDMLLECWKDDGSTRTLFSTGSTPDYQAGNEHDTPDTNEEAPDRAIFVWTGPFASWRRHTMKRTESYNETTFPQVEEMTGTRVAAHDAEVTASADIASDENSVPGKIGAAQQQPPVSNNAGPVTPAPLEPLAMPQVQNKQSLVEITARREADSVKSIRIKKIAKRVERVLSMPGSDNTTQAMTAKIIAPLKRIAEKLDEAMQEQPKEQSEEHFKKSPLE